MDKFINNFPFLVMEHAEIPQNAHNEIIVTEAQPYPNHPGPSHGYDQHVQHGYPPRNNAQMVRFSIFLLIFRN